MLKVIKNQEYQTRNEVIKAAGLGRRCAILSSIRHWKELATAPVGDLKAFRPGFSAGECALCEKYDNDCHNCPLYVVLGNVVCHRSGELYNVTSHIINDLRDHTYSKATRDRLIKRFRRAAEKMIKVLESSLE